MMKATKMRKNLKGTGTLYRLDPPYQHGGETTEVVLVTCMKHDPVIPGFITWPAFSEICQMEEREPDRYWRVKRVLDIQGRCLTHAQVLKQLGYTL